MAKRTRQQKRQLTVGKLLAALLALWAVGAGLWFHYDFPLPEPLAEEITTVEKLAEEKLPGVWSALSDRLTALLEKPEEQPDAPEEPAAVTLDTLPDYDGSPYVELYNGQPSFTEEEQIGTAS